MGVVATPGARHPPSVGPSGRSAQLLGRMYATSGRIRRSPKQGARALGDERGALLGHEMPAIGHDLDGEIVGVALGAVQQERTDGGIAGADHDPRRHRQAPARACARPRAAGRCGRASTLARARSGSVSTAVNARRSSAVHASWRTAIALIRRAREALVGDQPPAEQRRGEHHLVGEAPDLQQLARRRRAERARGAQGEERREALRRGRAGQEADPGAPVVADEAHALAGRARRGRRGRRRPSSACRSRRAARRTSRSRAGRS